MGADKIITPSHYRGPVWDKHWCEGIIFLSLQRKCNGLIMVDIMISVKHLAIVQFFTSLITNQVTVA